IRKSLYRSCFFSEIIQFLNSNAVQVEDGRIPFCNRDNLAAIFLRQKFRGVVADVAETLKYNSLSFQARGELQLLQVFLVLKRLSNAELNSPSRGFTTPMYSALCHWLSRNAG